MSTAIWLLAGALLAIGFISYVAKRPGGSDRILAIGLFVAGFVYVAFAIGSGSAHWILIESLGAGVCGVVGWLGVRVSTLWLAAGWALHPAWDVGLHVIGPAADVAPHWYAILCISFDLLVAAYVWVTLKERTGRKRL